MFRLSSIARLAVIGGIAALIATACGGSSGATTSPSPTDVGQGSLTGAGATFPGPFYLKAFADYSARYPQVTVNYQAVALEPASNSSSRRRWTSARAMCRWARQTLRRRAVLTH